MALARLIHRALYSMETGDKRVLIRIKVTRSPQNTEEVSLLQLYEDIDGYRFFP